MQELPPAHALSLAATLALALASPAGLAPDPARDDGPRWNGRDRVVHEWGTFTSIQGSDGVALGGLLHEERDLPEFVYDVRDFAAITGYTPKMETPVVYFYAPEEWRVEVEVGFPRGLVTQWYPAPTAVNLRPRGSTAPVLPEGAASAAAAPLRDGHVAWGERGDLTVLAPEDFAPDGALFPEQHPSLPEIEEDDPWVFARKVRSNLLHVHNTNRLMEALQPAGGGGEGGDERLPGAPTTTPTHPGDRPGAPPVADPPTETSPHPALAALAEMDEHERFLFYRGLGDFPLPLRARVRSEQADGARRALRLDLENTEPAGPATHLFLVYVERGRAGFARLADVAGRLDDVHVELELAPFAQSTELLVESLAVSLAETGLYYDEALAMARTWQHGYFQDEGLRLLYVLPAAFVDRELPLRVTSRRVLDPESRRLVDGPACDSLVRTFVARTELLSPEREQEMLSVARALALGGASERAAAHRELERWGRFATPYLNRVRALAEDERVVAAVERELARLGG